MNSDGKYHPCTSLPVIGPSRKQQMLLYLLTQKKLIQSDRTIGSLIQKTIGKNRLLIDTEIICHHVEIKCFYTQKKKSEGE